jgi:tetratricopeptide (TPR) repeat protein
MLVQRMSDHRRSLSDDEQRLFATRIAKSLAEQPLTIDPSAHRERVAGLLRQMGGLSHYDLLAIGPTAPAPEIHQAYERLARLVHPDNAARLGLGGKESVLEVLFERATQAYLILSHPERRKDYDRELGPETTRGGQAPTRAEANRNRARQLFTRASALAASEEYHFATELAREATRIDPRAEYFALLGDLLAKNERWRLQAVECYTRALALGGPADVLTASLQQLKAEIDGVGGEATDERPSGRRKR